MKHTQKKGWRDTLVNSTTILYEKVIRGASGLCERED